MADELVYVRKLGSGQDSACYLAILNGKQYTYKITPKEYVRSESKLKLLNNERTILASLNHPNIVKYISHGANDTDYFLILEYHSGASLADILRSETLTDAEIKTIYYHILSALDYLHKKKIIHRDVKAGNILFNGVAKLCDFGFAIESNDEYQERRLGTPLYIAPELAMGRKYSYPVDIWAFGVTMFIMYNMMPPFNSNDDGELVNLIQKGEYYYTVDVPVKTKEAIDLMITVDPNKRPTADELLRRKFT